MLTYQQRLTELHKSAQKMFPEGDNGGEEVAEKLEALEDRCEALVQIMDVQAQRVIQIPFVPYFNIMIKIIFGWIWWCFTRRKIKNIKIFFFTLYLYISSS